MSSTVQTVIALTLVALAAAYLLRPLFQKKQPTPGCGCGPDCGALSPEVRKLQARLQKQPAAPPRSEAGEG